MGRLLLQDVELVLPQQLLMGEELELVSVLEGAPGWGVHGGPQRGCPVHQLRWGTSRDAVREAGGWGWLKDLGWLKVSVSTPVPGCVGHVTSSYAEMQRRKRAVFSSATPLPPPRGSWDHLPRFALWIPLV